MSNPFIMRVSEIVAWLEDLSVPLTADNINRPTSEHISRVYEVLTDLILGTERDEYEPNETILESLERPQLLVTAVKDMSYFRTMCQLMQAACIEGFSMNDLMNPTPQRVIRVLSALHNYYAFRKMRLSEFQKIKDNCEILLDQKAEQENKNAELAERIDEAKEQRAAEEPRFQKLAEQRQEREEEIKKLNERQEAMTAEFHQLKKMTSELTERVNKSKTTADQTRLETKRLSSQIVKDPDHLKQSLRDLTSSLAVERENVTNLEKKTRELQAKLELLAQVDIDVGKAVTLMQEVEVEMKRVGDAQRELQRVSETVSAKQAEIAELQGRHAQLKRGAQAAQEKAMRQDKQQAMRREASDARMAQLRKEVEGVNCQREMLVKRIEEQEAVIKELQEENARLVAKHEVPLRMLRADVVQLADAVKSYHKTLAQSIRV